MKRFNGIKNPHKMYATYNLQNAAHNYCHEQDIYLILDGDDELVGHQVFKLLNAKYQEKDNWIVYTSYFSSKFSYGNSQRVHRDFFEGKRVRAHIMGPVRTYYNSLYKKIDNKQHKDKFGQYLKTAYDEAMQFPLFEMAGFDRIEYVRQLCYFYNMY